MSRVLILDEDPYVSASLRALLERDGHACETARGVDEALLRLEQAQDRVELLITEMQVSGGESMNGLKLLRRLRERHPQVVPLVVTGFGKIEDAVRAIKLGAADYLTKPVLDEELRSAVRKASELHALLSGVRVSDAEGRRDDEALGDAALSDESLERALGWDVRVHAAIAALPALGEASTPVLVVGEAGTGRSRLGRALHARSSRRGGPCVEFTCRADEDPRHVAELVGHTRDAFAEEAQRRPGALGEARGGTLVVRALQRATPAVQSALMSWLAEGVARPIGSSAAREVDVRGVFTVEPEPAGWVRDGALRSDLLYRVSGAVLTLPALRTRPDDLFKLAEGFVASASARHGRRVRVGAEALARLRGHDWPGNVSELRSACEHAVLHATTRELMPGDWPPSVRPATGSASAAKGWTPMPLAEALLEPERRILLAALEANGWNRSETARQLQIDRTTLYKKIRRFRLDEPG